MELGKDQRLFFSHLHFFFKTSDNQIHKKKSNKKRIYRTKLTNASYLLLLLLYIFCLVTSNAQIYFDVIVSTR